MSEKNRSEGALDQLIAQKFSTAFMSNAKWVKLISKLIELAPLLDSCLVKLIWDDHTARRLLLNEHTAYQFDYYPTAMEGMITGKPKGWYSYKEIEWIEITPLPSSDTAQKELDEIHQQIARLSTFCIEKEEHRLKIVAYRLR